MWINYKFSTIIPHYFHTISTRQIIDYELVFYYNNLCMKEEVKIWDNLLDEISKDVSSVSFDLWFKNLEPISLDFGKLILVCSSDKQKELLKSSDYKKYFTNSIKKLNNPLVTECVVINKNEKESYIKDNKSIELESSKEDSIEETVPYKFNENYTFDNFVVGNSNNIAKAAAFAVAQNPGKSHNPLFIYGGVGLGKTHILHAIGNYVTSHNPSANIIYTTTEQFVNNYVYSITHNKNNEQNFKFREKYRKADILMLDDVQFLSGKDSSQEAIFHTFNDLYQANKQIVLTSDRHPRELNFLEERLRSRFQSGLNVDISSPDLETRIAIIQKKAFQQNFNFSKSIVYFIAENITSNIREIEGALKKVIFYCQLNNKDCADDLSIVREALKDDIDISSHILTMDSITDAVCSYYNITKEEIKGGKKSKNIALPRQVAIYLILELLSLPQMTVSDYFGDRDHSAIIYARDKIATSLETDNLLKKQVKDIRNIIQKN